MVMNNPTQRVPMQNAPPAPLTLPSHASGPVASPDIQNVQPAGVEPWHLQLTRTLQGIAIVTQNLKELIEILRPSTNCVIYTVLNPGTSLPVGAPAFTAPFAPRWLQVTNRNVAGGGDALVYLYDYQQRPINANQPVCVTPQMTRRIDSMGRHVNVIASTGNLSAIVEFWG